MRRVALMVSIVLQALLPRSVVAQTCPATPPNGAAKVWLEFQVEAAAQFISDSAAVPYPDRSLDQRQPFPADFALVQFVVDTNGRAEAKSLRLLVQPPTLSADVVRAASARWHFKPATVGGCRVPQLVQVALRWKSTP